MYVCDVIHGAKSYFGSDVLPERNVHRNVDKENKFNTEANTNQFLSLRTGIFTCFNSSSVLLIREFSVI